MRKLILLVSLLFTFTMMSTVASGQQGQAMLKIVKSENGAVNVYDMQGIKIQQSTSTPNELIPGQETSIQTSNEDIKSSIDSAESKPKKEQPAIIKSVPGTCEKNSESEKENNESEADAMNSGADLVIDGGWTYLDISGNPSIEIHSGVANVGTSTSANCYVAYYLSSNKTWSSSDIYIGRTYVSTIAAGSERHFVTTLDLSAYPGAWYFIWYADYSGLVNEADETNNTAVTENTISISGPNLTRVAGYSNMTYDYSTRRLDISFRVINNGTVSTGTSSQLGYYLSSNTDISTSDTKLLTGYVITLSAGAYEDNSIAITDVCKYVSDGTWYVGYLIDETDAVAETDETDNEFYFSSPISVTCSDAPNLTANGQPANYNYSSDTHQLDISVRVINSGGASAGSSRLGYYLSDNKTIETSDIKLGTDYVSALSAGSYSDETFSLTDICDYVPNGTWYVGFIIDEADVVTESDETDNNWNFTPAISVNECTCSITVTSPTSDVWDEGSTQTITWTSNATSGNVKISYSLDAGTTWIAIIESTPDDGEELWTLPNVSSDMTDCRVKVQDVASSSCNDVSNGSLTIRNVDDCGITVTSPNGGEIWYETSTQNILWTSFNTSGQVKISYTTDGSNWNPVTSGTPDDGKYVWTVPAVTSDQTQCRVKVENASNSACSDMSDADFTIGDQGEGNLVVLVPNCKVAWQTGRNYKISWIPAGKSGNVKIEYSLDNGISWNTIVASTADDGCYCWTIPNGISSYQAFIRITDSTDGTCTDQCNLPFTIGTPATPYLMATDITGVAGATVTCELILNGNNSPIDALSFILDYDVSQLSYVSIQKGTLTSDWNFLEGNETTPGVINIGGMNPSGSPIPAESSGSIAKVTFTVTCSGCTDCSQSHLYLDNMIEDLSTVHGYCGTYGFSGCCSCGDVNNNGLISSEDALCAFRIYLAGGTLPTDCPECQNECALSAADVNKNGVVSSEDALGIFKYYLNGYWDSGFCGATLAKKQRQTYSLTIENVVGQPGDVVKVPVKVDNPQGISAFGLKLEYPAHLLEYVGTSPSSLTKDWVALDGNESVTGVITLGGFHVYAIGSSTEATVAEISFLVKEDASGEGYLNVLNMTDDLAESFATSGIFSSNSAQNIPMTFKLNQNHPNPFNMQTEISYQLAEATHVKVIVYNTSGQKVRTLVDSKTEAGIYSIRWDGKNDLGETMASGVYIYKLESSNNILSRKMILMK